MTADQDRWARWIERGRDGGDPEVRRRTASVLATYRDGVLARAAVNPGDVLLDVGTGDGLIGLAALDRVGPAGQVVFSDVSADLLAGCRRRVEAMGHLDRCRFVEAAADNLLGVDDRSVDAVTTRSVLIYVERRPEAFAEFFRVLRPGGRLSIFEPINRFALVEGHRHLFGLDLGPVADLAAKVWPVLAQRPPEQNPMVNFDERDLLRWAAAAGFVALELDYRAEVGVPAPLPSTDWDVLTSMAPNPLAPTLGEALTQALTPAEHDRFETHVRAALAGGASARTTLATAYLRGIRP